MAKLSFLKAMDEFKTGIQALGQERKKRMANAVLEEVVRTTPVDTGHLKSNNQVALNGGAVWEREGVDPDGAATLMEGKAVIASAKPGDDIHIANPTSYAEAIEHGSSQQAPQGVYRRAALAAQGQVG